MATSDGTFSVSVETSISDIDKALWDSLAGNNVVSAHGWFQAFEEETVGSFEPSYVLLHEGGKLVAATSCFLCQSKSGLFNPDEFMYGRFSRLLGALQLSFYPAMLVGSHGLFGYQRTFLLSDGLSDKARRRACQLLLTTLETLAQSVKVPLHLPYVLPDKELDVTRLLAERGYLTTRAFPVCFLDIEWDSFDGYLSYLHTFSKKMRQNVKEEIRRFKRAGFTVEVIENPSEYGDRLFELADTHYRSYNQRGVTFTPQFLPKVKRLLGQDAVFYGAFRENSLVGFVVLVKRGEIGYLPWTGIDRETSARSGTYFNLVFYRPVEDANRLQIKRLYFGRALYKTKVRRGCRVYGPRHFYRSPNRAWHGILRPWFAFHENWMRRKMGETEDLENLRHFKPDG